MALFEAGYAQRRLEGKTSEALRSLAKDVRLAGTFAATVAADDTSGSFLAKGAAACFFHVFSFCSPALKAKSAWTYLIHAACNPYQLSLALHTCSKV